MADLCSHGHRSRSNGFDGLAPVLFVLNGINTFFTR